MISDPAHSASNAAQDLKVMLQQAAREAGLATLRITTPEGLGDAGERLMRFLAAGHHGTMAWMETHAERRRDVRALWPDARSVIMLGHNYGPDVDPMLALDEPDRGALSVYAKGRDYHDVIKGRLKQVAGTLEAASGKEVKVFVDTAPLMEKPLAQAAGIGWQGKHTNLVSREFGSWLFLGAILSAAEIAPDAPESDHCGRCRQCLDVCPTGAFPAPYQLDARRCLAYLTIEHKGHIAREFRRPMRNRVFGCDDCLAVCPWNKFAQDAGEAARQAPFGTSNPPLADLLQLDDAAFRKMFAGTPIKRTGRDRFLRNCLIAAGNSRDPNLLVRVIGLLRDGSALVRAMAVWAASELSEPEAFETLRRDYMHAETDAQVKREWQGE